MRELSWERERRAGEEDGEKKAQAVKKGRKR